MTSQAEILKPGVAQAVRTGEPFGTGRHHSRVRNLPEVLGELPMATMADEMTTPGEGQIRALVCIAVWAIAPSFGAFSVYDLPENWGHSPLVLDKNYARDLVALLAQVAEGTVAPRSLKFYLASKDKRESDFVPKRVDSSGQVEGGLASFVEAEAKDIEALLSPRHK